ncbi:hypothetical protein [Citrobacter phage vB_CfrS_K1M]
MPLFTIKRKPQQFGRCLKRGIPAGVSYQLLLFCQFSDQTYMTQSLYYYT